MCSEPGLNLCLRSHEVSVTPEAGRASMNGGGCWMRCCMWLRRAASGANCPATFLRGRRCMSSSGPGATACVGARRHSVVRAKPQGQRSKPHAHRGDRRFADREDGPKRGQRGYDAGKKIKGRKWHIAVDTQGNLLTVVAHSAG